MASTRHGRSILNRGNGKETKDEYRKANAIGRSSKTVREFLERNHKSDMDRDETIKLTIKSLLEVVQTGAKNIEIAVMEPGKSLEMLQVEDIEKFVEGINNEKQDEENKRPGRRPAPAGGAGAQDSTTGPAVGAEAILASRPAGEGTGAPPE